MNKGTRMRFSDNVGQTLRESPADAELPGHALLVRASLVRSVGTGLFAWLPLGARALTRLASTVAQAMGGLHLQPVSLPGSGSTGVGLPEASAALFADVLRREVRSYRQFPIAAYEVAERVAGVAKPRSGPLQPVSEPAWQIYAAHAGPEELEALGEAFAAGLARLWSLCGLAVLRAQGEHGPLWVWPHAAGDLEVARCTACTVAAERSVARFAEPAPDDEPMLPPEDVATPDADTIAALAACLGIPERKTVKAVFYTLDRQVIVVLVRGDRAVDEAKVARVLGTADYAVSIEQELEAVGAVGGYGSAVGLQGARVLADRTVAAARNLVGGANRPGTHRLNLNLGRDYQADEVLDLVEVEAGDACPACGAPLALDHAFTLAEWRAVDAAPPVTYLDETGRGQEAALAAGWVGLGRVLAAVAEMHRDEHGLVWPAAVAPLDVHVVGLNLNQPEVAAQLEALTAALEREGLAVLLDDRDERPGVKFNDADLIGLPLRLTVSRRALEQGGVEVTWRHELDRHVLDQATLLEQVAAWQATQAAAAG
jgi:prolyl-tRNA synthetase